MSYSFSFRISPLGLVEENITGKYFIFGFLFHNFAWIPGWFSYVLCYPYRYYLLSSGWIVIVVCGFISVQEII